MELELEVETRADENWGVDEAAGVLEVEVEEVEEELAAAPLEPPEPPESSAPPGARGNCARGNLLVEV